MRPIIRSNIMPPFLTEVIMESQSPYKESIKEDGHCLVKHLILAVHEMRGILL